jgi:hypothetical protein
MPLESEPNFQVTSVSAQSTLIEIEVLLNTFLSTGITIDREMVESLRKQLEQERAPKVPQAKSRFERMLNAS